MIRSVEYCTVQYTEKVRLIKAQRTGTAESFGSMVSGGRLRRATDQKGALHLRAARDAAVHGISDVGLWTIRMMDRVRQRRRKGTLVQHQCFEREKITSSVGCWRTLRSLEYEKYIMYRAEETEP